MRKDKIVKVMMSAAVMMSVTAASAQAEGYEEESTWPETVEMSETEVTDCLVTEESAERRKGPGEALKKENLTPESSLEEGLDEGNVHEIDEGMMAEEAAREADYQPHSVPCIGPGLIEWQTEETEETTEYGPHCAIVTPQETTQEETEPLYSQQDLYILAHAICGEGQCSPDEEQLYIGSVILNRRDHGAYPNTIEGVVFQRGQYACTWDGNYYREPTEANWRNARWLLENGSILPANVVYQAGFFQGSGLYLQTRYHKYCYR